MFVVRSRDTSGTFWAFSPQTVSRINTSGEIRRLCEVAQWRDLEFKVFDAGHRQQVGDFRNPACDLLVRIEGQKHMRRPATIRDEHRAPPDRAYFAVGPRTGCYGLSTGCTHPAVRMPGDGRKLR